MAAKQDRRVGGSGAGARLPRVARGHGRRHAAAVAARWQGTVLSGAGRQDDGRGCEVSAALRGRYSACVVRYPPVQPVQVAFRYDVTPDGQRFLVNLQGQGQSATVQPISVVLNWLAGTKK